ncbi:hypothetical protein IT396_00095 [Candidatus Nomurabacteria bacterium]|nr:hypothetical protein [Candidatus Nomurabacteria bacterium]
MSKTKILCITLAVLVGIFFVIFGGYDDSPGLQLIGAVVVIGSIAWCIIGAWRK